jgi:hypothetical protein
MGSSPLSSVWRVRVEADRVDCEVRYFDIPPEDWERELKREVLPEQQFLACRPATPQPQGAARDHPRGALRSRREDISEAMTSQTLAPPVSPIDQPAG